MVTISTDPRIGKQWKGGAILKRSNEIAQKEFISIIVFIVVIVHEKYLPKCTNALKAVGENGKHYWNSRNSEQTSTRQVDKKCNEK